MATEGLQLSEQVNRADAKGLAHVILAKLEVAEGDLAAGYQRLLDQLAVTMGNELLASFNYELWCMGAGNEFGVAAYALYQTVYGRMPDYEYKLRLNELKTAVSL